MAPEQAMGKAVDKRADIWAFGCVVYEMLTGRRAFEGDSTAELLSGGGIFVMDATGESVRRITDDGFDPQWSPDGAELVVADEAVTDPMSRNADSQLWVVKVADGSRRLVSQAPTAWSGSIDFAADGQRLALPRHRLGLTQGPP